MPSVAATERPVVNFLGDKDATTTEPNDGA